MRRTITTQDERERSSRESLHKVRKECVELRHSLALSKIKSDQLQKANSILHAATTNSVGRGHRGQESGGAREETRARSSSTATVDAMRRESKEHHRKVTPTKGGRTAKSLLNFQPLFNFQMHSTGSTASSETEMDHEEQQQQQRRQRRRGGGGGGERGERGEREGAQRGINVSHASSASNDQEGDMSILFEKARALKGAAARALTWGRDQTQESQSHDEEERVFGSGEEEGVAVVTFRRGEEEEEEEEEVKERLDVTARMDEELALLQRRVQSI